MYKYMCLNLNMVNSNTQVFWYFVFSLKQLNFIKVKTGSSNYPLFIFYANVYTCKPQFYYVKVETEGLNSIGILT